MQTHEVNAYALQRLRRNAGARLVVLEKGGAKRWSGEREVAWDALGLVANREAQASAAYYIAAFASERDRASFALRLTERHAMIEAALLEGHVKDESGRVMDINL